MLEKLPGTNWVAGRLVDLQEHHSPRQIVCDGVGPAASIVQNVEEAGVHVERVDATRHAEACGRLVDVVAEQRLRHRGSLDLWNAIRGARARPLGDRWAWSRKNSHVDISPLVAATLGAAGGDGRVVRDGGIGDLLSVTSFIRETFVGPRLERQTTEESEAFEEQISNFWAELGSSAGWSTSRLVERVWVANRCQHMNANAISTMPLRHYGGAREPAWVANPDPAWYPNGISDAVYAAIWSSTTAGVTPSCTSRAATRTAIPRPGRCSTRSR